MESLPESRWHALRAAHESRVQPWIAPRLERTSRQEKHPVEDFLFEYYPYRSSHLLRWHPGLSRALQGESAREFLSNKNYRASPGGIAADPSTLPEQRLEFPRWLRQFLQATATRPAAFGCFGLHEWAMLYRTPETRHAEWPLRLTPDEIARTVEAHSLRCTHYDAFRFFTPAARPLNKVQPERAKAAEFDQSGCLHANMDLYKWAFKLAPFTPSELVADTFELARDIRTLDMRASPYDFRSISYEPVRIEEAEGRAEYERLQRQFAERAVPLRAQLITLCDNLLETAAELV